MIKREQRTCISTNCLRNIPFLAERGVNLFACLPLPGSAPSPQKPPIKLEEALESER